MSVWRQRLAAARILGVQGLAISPMAMIALLAFTAVRFGDNGFGDNGARLACITTLAGLAVTFINSWSFGVISRDGHGEMLLRPDDQRERPPALRTWLRSRTILSLLLAPAIIGFVWAVV